MVMGANWTSCSNHFIIIYRYGCTPETNKMLYVNDASIFKKMLVDSTTTVVVGEFK